MDLVRSQRATWLPELLSSMRRTVLLGLVFLIVSAGCTAVPFGTDTNQQPESRNATVLEVVDGDTIDVELADGSQDTVRLLGIDTPEVHADTTPGEFEGVPDTEAGQACLRAVGTNASAAVTERLSGSEIRLEFDPVADRRGGYDRLLAYVSHNETNLNYWLVERGYARVYDTEFTKADTFYAAESGAQAANRGVWNCSTLSEGA